MKRFAPLAAVLVVIAFGLSFVMGLGHRAPEAGPIATPTPPLTAHSARGRVEVMNGAGKPGLAKLATEQLRDAGFDVVQFGNATTTAASSSVLDRVGKRDLATSVGDALGITTVRTQIDASRYVDATVILGKDWPPPEARAVKKTWKDRLLRR